MTTHDVRPALDAAADKAAAGERISPEEALQLLRHERLTALGVLADLVRRRKHPDGVVSYIIDRNVNYTNVCNAFCSFCAFYRPPSHEEGYVLPAADHARLRLYDLRGRLVRTLLDGARPAGPGAVRWDGRDEDGRPAATGSYVARLESGGHRAVTRLLLVR